MLRRENSRLRAQIEADEAAANAEPSSSTNGNSEKVAVVPLGDEMSKFYVQLFVSQSVLQLQFHYTLHLLAFGYIKCTIFLLYRGVSTSIKAHKFARLLRGTVLILCFSRKHGIP